MSIQRFVSCLALAGLLTIADEQRSFAEDAKAASPAGPWQADPMDWPHWRGPEQNGVSRETGLVEKFNPRGGKGSNLLWKSEELGSRSTPIVMKGRLYTIVRDNPGTEKEGEKVVCVDPATGKIVWENRFNVFLSDVPDSRVGWSNVVGDTETGNVYALGVCDYFQCIDGKTGKTLWSRSLSEEYGMLNTYGGRTNSPTIHGDLVIISGIIIGWGDQAKPAHRFIAFDKRTGVPVWFEGTRLLPYDTTYGTPITTVIDGQAQMIFGSGDGWLYGFQPQTGKQIWEYEVSHKRGINTTPLVAGNMVFAGNTEENVGSTTMGALYAVDASKTGNLSENGGELWRKNEWTVGVSAPILVDDKLIAIEDNANLLIVDPRTGKRLGQKKLGTVMRGSPLYADGKIYCCTANGRWWVLKLDGNRVETLDRQRLYGEAYGSPIVSHGRVYLPMTEALYCIGDESSTPQAGPRPARPRQAPVSTDTKPAHVQVVPCESVLQPGQPQQYTVRLFNSRGQFLRTAKPGEVEFTIEGPGSIDADGRYHAQEGNGHAAVSVTASVGELKGDARVRVVPALPWSFDFAGGEIPATWVGIRYRHVPMDFDLFQKLRKAEPLAGNLYIYLTSGFVNSGRPALTFDDSTPQRAWTDLLRYLGLETGAGRPSTLDEAKKRFDPALKLLQQDGVVARWEWSGADRQFGLVVHRGPRKIDGNGVMCKITTIPKGTRSQGWFDRSDLSNQTIQADVMAPYEEKRLPDIGLQAQRYRLEMRGADQTLKLYSWIAHEIKYTTVPFEWTPGVWYTMKLQVSVEERDGGKVAALKGKVWPRDRKEPAEWTITRTDEPADEVGAPGLFGDAKEAEIFIDNVKVTKNE